MLEYIFPTFCIAGILGHELPNAIQTLPFLTESFEEYTCCSDSNCTSLGDGKCDSLLNLEYCAWDKGDCGYCAPECYLEMLNNKNCDQACNNYECLFDYGDCSRSLVYVNKNNSSQTITINNSIYTVSEVVETTIGNFKFDNIQLLSGTISLTYDNHTLIDLAITGDLTISNINYQYSPNKTIRIQKYGKITFLNVTLQNLSINIQDKSSNNLTINDFNVSNQNGSYVLNLTIEVNETQEFDFQLGSSNFGFTINCTGNSSSSLLNLTLSNINIEYIPFNVLVTNTLIAVSNSNFTITTPPVFTVSENSNLVIINSTLYLAPNFTNSTQNNFFLLSNYSTASLIDSNLTSCQGNYVANLDSSSALKVQNINFSNCIFQYMTSISEMETCKNPPCTSPPTVFSKTCPNGQMDLSGCHNCPDGYYRFEELGQIFCFECPSCMDCRSGQVFPKVGCYQFNGEISYIFRECYNPSACLGPNRDVNGTTPTNCSVEYTGNFCGACSDNYTSIGQYECGACPNPGVNALILIITITGVSALIIYMIKSTVTSSFEPSEFYSIAMRIGVNYFQVIYLCLQFRISWPANGNTNQANASTSGINGGSSYYFSLQCLLHSFRNHKDYYYARVTFMAILPIVIFLFSVVYLVALWIWRRCRNNRLDLTMYKPVTMIVPFLLVYPYVITYTLSPLACDSLANNQPKEFDEKTDYSKYKFLMEDPDILCTWQEHYSKIIWATGFSLIVWGFGIPLFIFYKLYKQRKNLFKYEVKYTFGFLISGYLHEHFYWEFLIFIKKLLIVFLTVFMQTGYSITLQSILLITFLLGGFILQIYYKPYITDDLNKLDTRATLAAIITVLAGIVYTELDSNNTTIQYFLIIVLVAINAWFIGYWMLFMLEEIGRYILKSFDCCQKNFGNSDGFNEDDAKENIDVNYVYIKEFQKLYTQAKFSDGVTVNYLGENSSYDSLIRLVVSSDLQEYVENRRPVVRHLIRYPTITKTRMETTIRLN